MNTKTFLKIFILLLYILTSACTNKKNANELHVVTAAEYPPFEYIENNQIMGFDIDIAKIIAKKLNLKIIFDNVQFSSVLAFLSSGKADIAISTITITDERAKNFDFSNPYYFEKIAVISKNNNPLTNIQELMDKKIACQLGTTMEIWINQNHLNKNLLLLNNNNQGIEALKTGYADAMIIDASQAPVFCKKNPGLIYHLIANSKNGYGIALIKNSPLTPKINKILHNIMINGQLDKLKQKWLK